MVNVPRISLIKDFAREGATAPVDPPPPPPHSPDMDERLRHVEIAVGKVESAIEGLRHSQNMTIAATLGVGAILAGFMIYGLQRIDSTDSKVEALPGKISTDLRDLTGTLATSITAARVGQPQVIIMPAPQQPATAPPTK